MKQRTSNLLQYSKGSNTARADCQYCSTSIIARSHSANRRLCSICATVTSAPRLAEPHPSEPGTGFPRTDSCVMFDDVVLLDDRLVAEGKNAGREDGRAQGFKEGEGMGQGKGFRTAAEMGFCRGCCLSWLALNDENPGTEKVQLRVSCMGVWNWICLYSRCGYITLVGQSYPITSFANTRSHHGAPPGLSLYKSYLCRIAGAAPIFYPDEEPEQGFLSVNPSRTHFKTPC